MEKLFVIQKRKLVIKEITVTQDTFIKAKDIGVSIFFDRPKAEAKLYELYETRGITKTRDRRRGV